MSWSRFEKDVLIMVIIFCFAIAYSCVIIKNSKEIDVKIGPQKEGTKDNIDFFKHENDTIK